MVISPFIWKWSLLPVQAGMRIVLMISVSYISWVLSNIMIESSHFVCKCNRSSVHRGYAAICTLCMVCFSKRQMESLLCTEHTAIWALSTQIIVYYLHPPSGADWVSWESWQLAAAIHGEGDDGVIFCSEIHKVMTTLVVIILFWLCCNLHNASQVKDLLL